MHVGWRGSRKARKTLGCAHALNFRRLPLATESLRHTTVFGYPLPLTTKTPDTHYSSRSRFDSIV